MNQEAQIKSILETVIKLTNFDFSQSAIVTENVNELDQIAIGVNKLAILLKQKINKKNELIKRLSDTQELANLGSWTLDFETNKMHWTKEAFEIYGKQPIDQEIPFDTFLATIHPNDRLEVNNAYHLSLLSDKDICEIEHRIIPENTNEIRYVLEKCKYERNELGNVVRSNGFVKDITEQKKADQIHSANLNELNCYKYALDKASIVAITNQKGIINYVNDNFCKISKYSREELIGQDHKIINSGFHSKAFIKNMWETIANGNVWTGEIKNKDKNGQFYWVETSIIPFLNENGKPYQYLSIRTDITRRKMAEESLLLNNNLLENKVNERTAELVSVIDTLKANKELLRKSETFSRTILNSLSSQIAVINKNGEIIMVNDAWNEFALNNGARALSNIGVGSNYFEVCENAIKKGDTDAKEVLSSMKKVLDKKVDRFQLEYPCHSPNEQRWFLMRVRKFDSEEPMIVVSHTDITGIKKAEEKILFHSTLLEAVQQSIIATDMVGKILYWNKAAEKIYGWSEEETIGKNIADIMLSEQTKEEGMLVLEQLSSGQSWSGELMLQRKNGDQFMAYISHSLFYNAEKEFLGIIGVSMDITENIKAREEIIKSNERYNLVAKATNDSIWELDIKTGRVTRTGDGFETLFGYEKEQQNSEELNYKNLVHPEDLVKLQESEDLAFNNPNEHYWELDFRILKANGEYAYVHDKGFIIRDDKGKAIRMIGATQDITSLVKHMNAVEEQNRKLKDIAWLQSHVVRAPLSRMMGIVNLLKDEILEEQEFKTWVGHFIDSSKELDAIIHAIIAKTDEIDLSE